MPWLRPRRRPLTAQARVESQVSPRDISGVRNATETGFSPRTSFLPCQCHSTIAAYSSLVTCFSYWKDNWSKPGSLQESNALSEIG